MQDYKLAKRRGLDISLLKDIVTKLANGEPLDPKYKDHPLSGNWIGHRECHIQPDWLLIYRYEEDVLVLTLTRPCKDGKVLFIIVTISLLPFA